MKRNIEVAQRECVKTHVYTPLCPC